MTALNSLFPIQDSTDPTAFMAQVKAAKALPGVCVAPSVLRFCEALSKRLLSDKRAKDFPACAAFGFWLRPQALQTLIEKYIQDDATKGLRRHPAGLVFLMPPSNVATLFGYVSLLSLLSGNVTVARLSSTPSPAQDFLGACLLECLAEADAFVRDRLFLVRYGHDDALTGAFSALADVRLVWGADETVQHMAALPMAAQARHVGFGDRFSAAAIDASFYLALDDANKNLLMQRFYADLYSFDQLACSSPRALFWVGDDAALDAATADFYPRLALVAESRGYVLDEGAAIARRNAAFLALHDFETRGYMLYGKSLAVVSLCNSADLSRFKRVGYGYGLLLELRVAAARAITDLAEPIDQTLSCAGIDPLELGAGYDRLVPVGRALDFDVIWDGCNLVDVMTRFQKVNL